jgi:acetyl-CoA C-acetyltransferase
MARPDYPVLVGFGQSTQRSDDPLRALEPIALAAQAARRAEDDAGVALLPHVDSVRVVSMISWDYGDAPGALAAALGMAAPRDGVYTTMGGNSPQYLVNATADDIASGTVRVALLAGAEAMYTQRSARAQKLRLPWRAASGAPRRTIGDGRWGTQEAEQRHGAAMPIHIYPLFENALRAAAGWSLEQHRARLGTQCARFSEIAASNPYSWFRKAKSAQEIATVTAKNRMIGFPYPKYMNSILDVDQAAAVFMTSASTARELGIPEDRWVYLHGGADAHDHWFILDRVDFTSSPAIRRAARAALDQAQWTIDDIDFLDLYSCFPCAPRLARDMLGIGADDPRDLTTTGSLMYFGGPGSNHPLHAIATMADRLRADPRKRGLVTGLGWYVTKHAIGLYSSSAPRRPWSRIDTQELQRDIDREPHPPTALDPEGAGTLETYTVLHDREGAPALGIVVGRLEDGRRFIANTPADRTLLEDMERRETIGVRGSITHRGSQATNLWQPI